MDIRDIVYVTEEDIQDVVVRWGVRDAPSFTAMTAEHPVHAII